MSAQEVVPDLLPRIRAAATDVRDATDAAQLAQRLRDQLIVQAVDAGISHRHIATAAGISKSRIVAILGNQYTEHLL
ncbi:MAG: hypothetical protein JWQ32_2057 [Marmoricola sp.]|nr:hypothetical protein [Marmoricola sp.]